MMISIIVLTYKKFDNLYNNFASIAKQTFCNYEIILQDDSSENFDEKRIVTMAFELGLSDKLKIETNSKNVGTVKNYNKAIKRSSGHIIVPLSQDDIFYEVDALEEIHSFFSNNSEPVCFSNKIGRISNRSYVYKGDIDLVKENDKERLWIRIVIDNFISGSVTYWRSDFLKNNMFDERYKLMEDYPQILRLINQGIRIGYIDKNIIEYGEMGVTYGSNPLIATDNALIIREALDTERNISQIRHRKLFKQYLRLQLFWIEKNNIKVWKSQVPLKLFWVKNLYIIAKIIEKLLSIPYAFVLAKFFMY